MSMLTRREFGFTALALATLSGLRAGTAWGEAKSTSAAAIDAMSLVDPELRPALQASLKEGAPTTWSEKTLPAIRERFVAQARAPLAQPTISKRRIPGPPGAPDVNVIVIGAAADSAPRPGILHIHGGGYIVGSAAGSIEPLQRLCASHGCVAVSVDYRLAPETPFPGSLEDNYAALRWLHANARELGIDRGRIGLLGESAGGGHVAALAQAARDRGEVPIAMQVMLYPMLDDRTGSSRKVPSHLGTYVWDAAANRFAWSSLLGVPAGSASVPHGSVPARARSLRGLPPAFIGVGAIDLFVEEDVAYAERLIQAGVPTELFVAPGGYHAFDIIVPEAKISKRFKAAWNDALRRGLNTSDAA
jgi:acetyl esterase/lipase